jgi:hypothetical protein
MTRREMMARMDSRELAEWEILYRKIMPFGPLRGDLQAGIIASLVANMFRDSKKHQDAYVPSDFVLKFGERKSTDSSSQNGTREQSWQQMLFNLQIVSARQDVATAKKKDT